MVALDFKSTLEEETFLQLIGLDRIVIKVTWEIMNVHVVQENIMWEHLSVEKSKLEVKPEPRQIQIYLFLLS